MQKLKNNEIEFFLDLEIPNDSKASFCISDNDNSRAIS